MSALFRFDGTMKRRDSHGNPITAIPTSIVAANIDEATEKARAAWGRSTTASAKFWSHSFFVESVNEMVTVGGSNDDK